MVNVMYIDTHIHVDGMSEDELRYMVSNGIDRAITCAYYPIEPRYPQTFLDLFTRLIDYDVPKAREWGLTLYVAIGIHPRSISKTGYELIIDAMKSLSEHEVVVAFGETGLQLASDKEINILQTQLELANELEFPIIVHTPSANKREITEKTLPLLDKTRINPKLVVIDHVNDETISIMDESGYNIGLTVQYGKLTPEIAAELVIQYSDNNEIVLNSDNGFRKCDIASVTKTINILKSLGADKSLLERVSHKNAENIFKI
jgi:predicted metal-dependent TIM-barrel fold hydrolase